MILTWKEVKVESEAGGLCEYCDDGSYPTCLRLTK